MTEKMRRRPRILKAKHYPTIVVAPDKETMDSRAPARATGKITEMEEKGDCQEIDSPFQYGMPERRFTYEKEYITPILHPGDRKQYTGTLFFPGESRENRPPIFSFS